MKKVYFDNAATTQVRNEVVERISEVLANEFGNPSSSHSFGRSSKSVLENCRKEIASYFKVAASEIIFTSGGTEADNLILYSCVRDLKVKRIISSKIEHHAVLHTIESLANTNNLKVDFVNLDANGMVDYNHLEILLKASESKTLVSLMHINNEVGNKINLKLVADLCKENNALFHSDTVQSVGHYELDFLEIPIDFAAVSAHKFHGPKGVGFAFIRKNSGLKPLIIGGEQERGLRAGTEAVYAIAGLTKALEISYKNIKEEAAYVVGIKNYFKEKLLQNIPSVQFNGYCGDNEKSTYTLLNVLLPISPDKATMLLFQLDLKGIACSKGSACQSGAVGGSHVLSEILSEDEMKFPSIRFSFSNYNTMEEVDYVIDVLKEIINN
ncbi:MAG: cysteine desulfurase [Flavobacterium sp.]|nr:MAG: cysteine desulfurase [Flavobacterium sp.]